MAIDTEYEIKKNYLTKPSKRRSGSLITPSVRFVVAHDTGNPGSTARGNVKYYENSKNSMSASAHIFVDDRDIIECIPAIKEGPPEKAWHVRYNVPQDNQMFGFDANDAAIGVEYCFGSGIDADEAYRRYVWIIAYILFYYRLSADRVVGHHFLDPQRKTDPVTGLARSRRTYDQLLKDIASKHALAVQQSTTPFMANAGEKAFSPAGGTVRTRTSVNVRHQKPTRLAPVVRTIRKEEVLKYAGFTDSGEPVNGNPCWLRDTDGNYLWSGATTPV